MKKDCFITAWCFSLAFISSRLDSPPSEGEEESASGTSTASWRSSSPPFPTSSDLVLHQLRMFAETNWFYLYWDGCLASLHLPLTSSLLFVPPQSQCSLRGKAERCLQPLKGTSRISGLSGAVPVQEVFPGPSSGVRDLLCSNPLDFHWSHPEQGPAQKLTLMLTCTAG